MKQDIFSMRIDFPSPGWGKGEGEGLNGSGAGPTKLKKIEEYNAQGAGIRIIGEEEFLEMINLIKN
ncbi:MAG: hypothetical protein M0Q51_17165 [Bacteroidales bacterium]|nr:hypothetical protein [Bacteroidales bacterium]